MLRVGLTGGIGSGKSEVSRRLAGHGAVVVDADLLAREVVAPGTDGFAAVVARFGPAVVAADGDLDRAELAARVFADQAARRALEEIIHPRVRARTAELIAAAPPDSIVVNDVPLLVEAGLADTYHLVIVVAADERIRRERLVATRGMSEAEAAARIAAQSDDATRAAAADVVLVNDGRREDLHAAVDRLWRDRLVPFEDNLRHHRRAPRPDRAILVEPDLSWPRQADRLRSRIRRVAGRTARRIDHIGSTSVPALAAKDVLDLQVVLDDLAAARRLAAELGEAGLVPLPGEWYDVGRDGARLPKVLTCNADPDRPANVHIRQLGSPAWRDTLLLRDWLRAHPDRAAEYAARKRELAARPHESVDAYAASKTPWINAALARAEVWAAGAGWAP